MTARAVVLAAGLGTRLRPLTDRVPKCLVEVGGRPLLDVWLAELARAGVRDVLVNTHHLREAVAAYLVAAGPRYGLDLRESYESELLGSAGTLAAHPGWIGEADVCVVVYADNLSAVDLADLLAFHRGHPDPFTMLLFHADDPRACGIAELDEDERIVSFVEKPRDPASDLANAGVYVLDAAAYREIAAMRGFDLGFDVLPAFVGRMRGRVLEGYHLDVGSPEALTRARADAPGLLEELATRPGARAVR